MKADHLSYSRAVSVSLLGLVLQLFMGLTLLIYSVLGRDPAAQSASYLILCGVPVWLGLGIVFDQHRRERLEAMEAESLAGMAARQTSVFETNAEDLRVAAKRLGWMHKFLLPAISAIIALTLLGVGLSRFYQARDFVSPDKFIAPTERGWALALGLGFAVVGFVFARFISGMAKQPVWSILRGGAAAAVAAALSGAIIAVSQFANIAGSDLFLRYAQIIVPGFMAFLGAEILLNILLNLYRPRKPGEVPRPAFDSRVLSFVASPDRIAQSIGGAINYQFGVDVTSSWAYQLLSRSVLLLLFVGAAVVWLLTCLEVVEPNERALRLRNGAEVGEVGPGLYVKWPWPFEIFARENTTSARRVDLMTGKPAIPEGTPLLWTNEHKVEEFYTIVQPTMLGAGGHSPTGDSGAAVQDIALVAVEVPLFYCISDLEKYERLGVATKYEERDDVLSKREELLRAVARREILAYFATLTEDDLLGGKRVEASAVLHKRVQAAFDHLNQGQGAGVSVLFVGLEGVHPDRDAAKSFEKVVANEQVGQNAVELGTTDAIKSLTEAVGSVALARSIAAEIDVLEGLRREKAGAEKVAAQEAKVEDLIMQAGGKAGALISASRADRWQRHMHERGRAEAYAGQLAAYRAAPSLYAGGLYFNMLHDLFKDSRVYITSDKVPNSWYQIDMKDLDTGGNVFTTPGAGP